MNIRTIKTFGILQLLLSGMLFAYLYHMGFPNTGIFIVGILFTAFTFIAHLRAVSIGMIYPFLDSKFKESMEKIQKMNDRYKK